MTNQDAEFVAAVSRWRENNDSPLVRLANEVRSIAESGVLPDGDNVNIPTLIWASEWRSEIELSEDNLSGTRERQ